MEAVKATASYFKWNEVTQSDTTQLGRRVDLAEWSGKWAHAPP